MLEKIFCSNITPSLGCMGTTFSTRQNTRHLAQSTWHLEVQMQGAGTWHITKNLATWKRLWKSTSGMLTSGRWRTQDKSYGPNLIQTTWPNVFWLPDPMKGAIIEQNTLSNICLYENGTFGGGRIFSSVRSSNSHPDLLVITSTHFFRSSMLAII